MKTIYVSIGNSDDKLTQREWAEFCIKVEREVYRWGGRVYGAWQSAPVSEYQNACWCFDVLNEWAEEQHKKALKNLAREYHQDSIAWAEVTTTQFLEPAGES